MWFRDSKLLRRLSKLFPKTLSSYDTKIHHHCTLGEDLYLRQNIFENPFFNYQKIRTDILSIEKKVS